MVDGCAASVYLTQNELLMAKALELKFAGKGVAHAVFGANAWAIAQLCATVSVGRYGCM